jgi:hypothetical protein
MVENDIEQNDQPMDQIHFLDPHHLFNEIQIQENSYEKHYTRSLFDFKKNFICFHITNSKMNKINFINILICFC